MNNIYFKYCNLVFILIIIIGCGQSNINSSNCQKFKNEIYSTTKIDTLELQDVLSYHKTLLDRFQDKSIKGISNEAYLIHYYSSHGFGKSIKFEKVHNRCSINVKCLSIKEIEEDCIEYEITLNPDVWLEFEKMIYEFDFWTTENYRANSNVLDGFAIFIEGNRPEAKECQKKEYNLIARGSPNHDKMESLFENINRFQSYTRFNNKNLIENSIRSTSN